jgi:hypothetical protein
MGSSSNWLDVDSILKQVPDDLGEDDYIEPLNILCRSFNELDCSTWFGRIFIRKQIILLLKNRAKLYQFVSQREIKPVKKPLFVLGLPRSGTTYLYNLLYQDPCNRSPKTWEIAYPFPEHKDNRLRICKKISSMSLKISLLKLITGDFNHIHPAGANLPEEDTIINLLSLRTILFLFIGNVKQYADYLQKCDDAPVMLWHSRFLQYLQSQQQTERWLLKAPGHVQLIQSLSDYYPEACFINIRRNPVISFTSLCSFADFLQSNMFNKVDHKELGRMMLSFWSSSLDKIHEYRNGPNADRLIDIEYDDFVQSPIGNVKAIYKYFNLRYSTDLENNMRQYIVNNTKQRQKIKKHQYSLAKYGLTEDEVRERIVV